MNYFKLNVQFLNTIGKRIKFSNKKIGALKTAKPYAIDLYPCIWRVSFIKKIMDSWLFDEKSIWDFEGKMHKLNSLVPLEKCYYCA